MRFKKVLNVNQMATCGAYKFKVARTANLKNGLTAGKKLACPVKSTGHANFMAVFTSTKKDGFVNRLFLMQKGSNPLKIGASRLFLFHF